MGPLDLTWGHANINNSFPRTTLLSFDIPTSQSIQHQTSILSNTISTLSQWLPQNSFDCVYAIEATVHAPSLEGVYSQIFKVLKPGGVFGVYEWLMTDAYDNDNPHHREIRLGIEVGDGISNMEKIEVALAAMKAAGFELEINEDLADRPDPYPWYWPLSGQLKYMSSIWDFPTLVRMTKIGRWTAHNFVGTLERFGLAPKGT